MSKKEIVGWVVIFSLLSALITHRAMKLWYHPPQIIYVDKEVIKEVQVRSSTEADLQLCRDKGGIPKTSSWDGRLTDCIKL